MSSKYARLADVHLGLAKERLWLRERLVLKIVLLALASVLAALLLRPQLHLDRRKVASGRGDRD
jgi:hypothetical protein